MRVQKKRQRHCNNDAALPVRNLCAGNHSAIRPFRAAIVGTYLLHQGYVPGIFADPDMYLASQDAVVQVRRIATSPEA